MILPPGMQKAFNWLLVITLTSHRHAGASARNTLVCGSSRDATARTRCAIAASVLSVPAAADSAFSLL